MNGRRGMVIAVALVAAGGAVAVVTAGRSWAQASLVAATGTPTHAGVSGHVVAPAMSALGLALVALAAATVAARGFVRRVVGALVVAIGSAVVAVAAHGHADLPGALVRRAFAVQPNGVHADVSPWWVVAACAGVVAVLAGALTVALAGRWPAMGARYETPAARGRGDAAATAWDALDRGEDPTL